MEKSREQKIAMSILAVLSVSSAGMALVSMWHWHDSQMAMFYLLIAIWVRVG